VLRVFIVEITWPLTCPVTIYCDNQSAISVSRNDQYHARTKNINICHHFIGNVSKKRLVTITYCPMAKNLPNTFTKALPGPGPKISCVVDGPACGGSVTV